MNVIIKDKKPHKVEKHFVLNVLDSYRLCPQWWLQIAPRNYYLLELETGSIITLYESGGQWTFVKTHD